MLLHRHHPSAELRSQLSVTLHKLEANPELFRLREHSMPKEAPKMAAAPRTPPASISKAPVAVPNSSFPTSSSPIEGADSTATVPDHGGPKKREKPRQ